MAEGDFGRNTITAKSERTYLSSDTRARKTFNTVYAYNMSCTFNANVWNRRSIMSWQSSGWVSQKNWSTFCPVISEQIAALDFPFQNPTLYNVGPFRYSNCSGSVKRRSHTSRKDCRGSGTTRRISCGPATNKMAAWSHMIKLKRNNKERKNKKKRNRKDNTIQTSKKNEG